MDDDRDQGRLRHRLETQSRQIERVFARHQLGAQIIGGTSKAGETRFDLRLQLENGIERLKAATSDIRKALGVSEIGIADQNGGYRLRLESPLEPQVSLLDLLALVPEWPGVTAALGLTEEGAPVLMDFRHESTAHMLITGDPETGKSSLLRTVALALSLAYRQSQVQLMVISDMSKEEPDRQLEPLQFLPHMLAPVARGGDEAVEVLSFLVDELEYRRQQRIVAPAIILMVDEVVALSQYGDNGLVDLLVRLAQRGADSGIHLVLTTKYPELEPMDDLFKSNLPVRIVGKIDDGRRSVAASGTKEPSVGYVTGQGEFAAVIDGNRPTLFQSAHVTDYDLHLSLRELQRCRPRPILAQTIDVSELRYGRATSGESAADRTSHFTYDGWEVALPADAGGGYELLDDADWIDDTSYEEE